ncbi:MAG: glycine zipper 2TM domain-containing protein [Fischerella sp.]|nr:glycine zipper 2TM domain-containing protein [Fischerella sp.]
MKSMTVGLVLAASVPLISGCPANLSGNAYTRDQVRQAQHVQLGYVENVRQVMIEGTKSGVGTVAGAALGGLAGSNIGKGRGQVAGVIGGAVLGGLAGSAIEESATRQPGLEITVRLDSGRLLAVTQAADESFYPGDRVRVLTSYDGVTRVVHDDY